MKELTGKNVFILVTIRCQHPSYFVLIEKLMEEDEAVNDFLFNRVEVKNLNISEFFNDFIYRTVCQLDL